jgi:alpha-glucosidase
MKALRTLALLTLAATMLAPVCPAQMASAAPQKTEQSSAPWWKHAVFYEIYPRSFQDSNGDGVGDLNGITERLDYLKTLGINAIWIAPAYPSPQVDFGYDISDYESIDPQYGTLKDFDHMLAEAKHRDIRIIMDMVLNHTSDKHPWFIESASSRTNPKADWYMWNDGKIGPDGKHMPPNNWTSEFGGSAWEWVPARQQYYYHKFYKEQPDLNWRNPVVEKAMFDQMRFWLDRGVAGFRLDAIDTLLEDPQNRDEEIRKGPDGKPMYRANGDPELIHTHTNNLPEIHDIIKRMRKMADSYPGNRVLIGETYLPNIAELDKWYGGAARNELQLPMDTQVGLGHKFGADEWRRTLGEAETEINGSMPLLVIDNHDNPRMDRYCEMEKVPGGSDAPECLQLQKMLTTVLFTARDAALFYYGDEIGMKTTPPTRVEDVKDPVGRRYWPMFKGRDGERTPMQWTPGKDAGFSTADTTWLPIPPDYVTVNVQTETPEKTSMLDYYQKVIALRRTNDALHDGRQAPLHTSDDANVLAYTRIAGDKKVIVVCNFSNTPKTVSLDGHGSAHTLAANYDAGESVMLNKVELPAYGAFVGEVK